MGLIENGKVWGTIPEKSAFAVNYPGYPPSIPQALRTLGGPDAISEARSSPSSTLELYFRPDDPYSHPVSAQLRPCNNLLLKISKKNAQQKAEGSGSPSQVRLNADIVSRVSEAYHFEGMADYQHVVAVHAEAIRKKKRNWAEMEEPSFEKVGLIDLDHQDLMIMLPRRFSLKDKPENLVLRPPSLPAKKKQEETVDNQYYEMNIEPALAIDFNVKDIPIIDNINHFSVSQYLSFIPKEINWRQCIPQGSEMWRSQMVVSDLFDERPIWQKDSVIERLLDRGLRFSDQMVKRLLLAVAYYFSGGPFLRLWIRKGYDPRKDPGSRMYQRIDFRVAPPLRSYCDANAAKGLNHRWGDLCKFQVFPSKCHTSFQLCDLDDDYIQEEIKKPSARTTCFYGTGWFTQHEHDCLRLRVVVRFLSIYPEADAKKFLKAANNQFEKLRCVSIHKDALKPDQEQDPQNKQTNEEVIDGDPGDRQPEVDNDDDDDNVMEEEIEADGHEEHDEELDAYHDLDLDLDLDGREDEMSLQSQPCILHVLSSVEGLEFYLLLNECCNPLAVVPLTQDDLALDIDSRSYLQDLFGSFPSTEDPGKKSQEAGSSEEEYQIFEQDDDDVSSLDDDDE